MTVSPYYPLEVFEAIDAGDRRAGRVYFVRDEEVGALWHRVEYLARRLTCHCDDGVAHDESPATEAECVHLRAVVDQRAADRRSSGPALGVLIPSRFVD